MTEDETTTPEEGDLPTDDGADDGAGGADAGPADEPELSEQARVEAERDKLKDQLLRTAADFDNFRKRSQKELVQAERRGREAILLEVLPIVDNLERAVQASESAADAAAVRQGVEMVLKSFADIASRIGLEAVESVGQRFDPNIHDAFQQQETDAHPPGTIVTEYQKGYRLGDKLLRPAMVVVAKKPPAPPADEPSEEA